jgi:ketosteroid isomerase-like protein
MMPRKCREQAILSAMTDADTSTLRELYAAFNARDLDGIERALDPDVEVEPTEDLAYAAALLRVLGPRFMILSSAYHGAEEVLGLFRTVWEIAEWFTVEPHEYLQMEDLVVVPLTLRARARTDQREGEAETAHLWTMAGGRALRLCVFPDRDDAVAAALRELKAKA